MTYQELLASNEPPSYPNLLKCAEWKEKRMQILDRDNHQCTKCSNTKSYNHLNFHVYFKPGSLIAPPAVYNYRISLAEYKTRFEIDSIAIYHTKPHPFLYGVSNRYTLFAVAPPVIHMDRQEISIGFFQKYKEGALYPIILPTLSNKVVSIHEPLVAKEAIELHVHHRYYVVNSLPWEYEDDALVTMCHQCHWQEHQENGILVYQSEPGGLRELNVQLCTRCSGAGFLPEYRHVQGGVCFKCMGQRFTL